MKWQFLGAVAPVLLLAGCAGPIGGGPYREGPNDPGALMVVAQVCLADRTASFDGIRDVRLLQVVHDGVVPGADAHDIDLADTTDAGQPVYEGVIAKGSWTVMAVGVRTRNNTPARPWTNWFRPPAHIPVGVFTPWQKPSHVELDGTSPSVQWQLLNGRPLPPRGPVAKGAPRVRFALLTAPGVAAPAGAGGPAALPEVRHPILERQGLVPPCR